MRKKREGMVLLLAEKRSELLRGWIDAHTTAAELARCHGCTRQYISWLVRHPFGWDAARNIEEKFGIPKYALEPKHIEQTKIDRNLDAENFSGEKGITDEKGISATDVA